MFYIFFIYLFYIFIKSTRKKGSSLIDPKAAFLNAFFAFLAYIGREKNHSIETSNAHAYDWLGNQVRKKYHENERNKETVYIHASKTRIIDIYNDLADGYELDGRGNRKA